MVTLFYFGASNSKGHTGMFLKILKMINMKKAAHGTHLKYAQRGRITRSAMMGIDVTIRAFFFNAPMRSPWSSRCKARREPQPGQYKPVSQCIGHGGKRREMAGSKKNNAPRATIMATAKEEAIMVGLM